jgi:hypothetical protein
VGRRRGDATAFNRFATLPMQLSDPVRRGGSSRLFSLFHPQAATAPIYHSFVAALGKPTLIRRMLAFSAPAEVPPTERNRYRLDSS